MTKKYLLILSCILLIILTTFSISYAKNSSIFSLSTIADTTETTKNNVKEKITKEFNKVIPNGEISEINLYDENMYNKKVWKAIFKKDGEIWTDSNTEETVFLINQSWFEKDNKNTNKETWKINKDNVIDKANLHMKNINNKLEGKLVEKRLIENLGNMEGINQWFLKWQREYNGYLFHDDWTILTLEPAEGTLFSFNKKYGSNNPKSLDIQTVENQARLNADSFIKSNSKDFKLLSEKPELVIVNPNYRWTSNLIEEFNPNTRLAWVFNFDKLNGKGEVWIDAENGDLLGGEESK